MSSVIKKLYLLSEIQLLMCSGCLVLCLGRGGLTWCWASCLRPQLRQPGSKSIGCGAGLCCRSPPRSPHRSPHREGQAGTPLPLELSALPHISPQWWIRPGPVSLCCSSVSCGVQEKPPTLGVLLSLLCWL